MAKRLAKPCSDETHVISSPSERCATEASAVSRSVVWNLFVGGPPKPFAPVKTDRILPTEPSRLAASASVPPALPTAERRLKLIIETAPVSLMILDPSGHLLAANRAALSVSGIVRLDNILGTSVGTLIAPKDREHFTASSAASVAGRPNRSHMKWFALMRVAAR